MQRPKQEGLGAAFGANLTDQAFGARTTDVLQKATVWFGISFFVVVLAISVLQSRIGNSGPSAQAEVAVSDIANEASETITPEPIDVADVVKAVEAETNTDAEPAQAEATTEAEVVEAVQTEAAEAQQEVKEAVEAAEEKVIEAVVPEQAVEVPQPETVPAQ